MIEPGAFRLVQRRILKWPKSLIKQAVAKTGFEIRRKALPKVSPQAKQRDEFDNVFDVVRDYTMVSGENLRCLYEQAVFCERNLIKGDFVECGVWKGGSVGVMALANLKHGGSPRALHLFDAFDDICEPDEEIDGARAISEVRLWTKSGGVSGKLVPLKGIYDQFGGHGTVAEARALLEGVIRYDPSFIHYHKGWFQDTLPKDVGSIRDIAILRLDGDWYASTKVCLDYLFDKVVPGGFVIIDDYGAYDGCRKAVDEFIGRLGRPYFLNVVNSETRYLIKA